MTSSWDTPPNRSLYTTSTICSDCGRDARFVQYCWHKGELYFGPMYVWHDRHGLICSDCLMKRAEQGERLVAMMRINQNYNVFELYEFEDWSLVVEDNAPECDWKVEEDTGDGAYVTLRLHKYEATPYAMGEAFNCPPYEREREFFRPVPKYETPDTCCLCGKGTRGSKMIQGDKAYCMDCWNSMLREKQKEAKEEEKRKKARLKEAMNKASESENAKRWRKYVAEAPKCAICGADPGGDRIILDDGTQFCVEHNHENIDYAYIVDGIPVDTIYNSAPYYVKEYKAKRFTDWKSMVEWMKSCVVDGFNFANVIRVKNIKNTNGRTLQEFELRYNTGHGDYWVRTFQAINCPSSEGVVPDSKNCIFSDDVPSYWD